MKAQCRKTKIAALAAALLLGAFGYVQANEQDTNITTVAYWKLAITNSNPYNVLWGDIGVPDLATNVGQGIYPGTNSAIPASVQDMWVLGPMAGSTTYANDVPPAIMFNTINYFNAGSASWDCGADEYSGPGGEISCDPTTYGTNFDSGSFTEEVFFKTDYIGSNTPSMDTVKQTLIWNHRYSAYAQLQLNEQGNGNMPAGVVPGSLLFWGWNVTDYPFIRITAALNGGQRFDDGKWHYACCRYNASTSTMDLFVVNEDGSSAEASTYTGSPLNAGGPNSQGAFIVGNDEGEATPFDGKINQVRFSNASLPASQLLANASACNAPSFPAAALVPSTNSLYAGGSAVLAPVYWLHNWPFGIQMQGGPLSFSWLKNGTPLAGQTNYSLSFPVAVPANSGTYQLVASTPCSGSITSAPLVTVVLPILTLAHWSFESTVTNASVTQASVWDVAPYFGGVYNLITYNIEPNLTGIGSNGEIPLTNTVPPTSMFINGYSGGTNAFDSGYMVANGGQDGVVFYPAGPDVFDFTTSFSIEVFFKTYGNQSSGGTMELVCQGTDGGNTFRYGVNVNQADPGALTFNINNMSIAPTGNSYEDFNNPATEAVTLTNANYADGNWHYLLAQYNSAANTISLSVANADGSGTNETVALPAGYSPLASNSEGNLFVGRYRYPFADDNRNFIGAIDEVQISEGIMTPGNGQEGFLVGYVQTPVITGITLSNGTVTISFTGNVNDPTSAFSVVASGTIGGVFSTTPATITSLGSGNFQATLPSSGAAEFYRIKR